MMKLPGIVAILQDGKTRLEVEDVFAYRNQARINA
jgi:hypothetical protein